MTTDTMTRRLLALPAELWAAVQDEAELETLETGERVSAAAWIRVAIRERLEQLRHG